MPEPILHSPLLWEEPDWLAEATGWIRARLAERGLQLTGEIEQPHVQWWSTVMRVPTGDGTLWFKANAQPQAFEARLISTLNALCPGRVPELVAFDADRGWLLARDGGTRLRELVSTSSDLHHWREVLPAYARLQLATTAHVERLVAAGVPDARLALLPAQLEPLLEDREALLIGRLEGLTRTEHEQLRGLLPEFAATCERLSSFGIPETIQHDDFHDGNVSVRDGAYRFFDWGDACISHPFHTLVVTMRALAHRLQLPPGGRELLALRDAYLHPFSAHGSPDDLREAVELALHTGTAARALAWHRFLSAQAPEARADDAETVPYGLKRLLQGGPIGSW
jgi:hypothetical protein